MLFKPNYSSPQVVEIMDSDLDETTANVEHERNSLMPSTSSPKGNNDSNSRFEDKPKVLLFKPTVSFTDVLEISDGELNERETKENITLLKPNFCNSNNDVIYISD